LFVILITPKEVKDFFTHEVKGVDLKVDMVGSAAVQRFVHVFVSVIAFALPSGSAFGECPPACDLDGLRARALARAPEIAEAEARVDLSEARLDEARFAALDVGRVDLGAYPTALRQGDMLHSAQPDITFSDEMGLYATIRVEALLAITPWWLIVELWRAARGGVEMSSQELEIARSRAIFAVDRAYRDAQVASAVVVALRRARHAVERSLAHIQRLLDEDLPGAEETDRLRFVVMVSSLEARQSHAERDRRLAMARLRQAAGLRPTVRLTISPLETDLTDLAPLDWYLETARRHRPEVRLSLAGIRASSSLVRARQAELVPELAVGLYYGFRRAPLIDDQTSPFVDDPWNGMGIGYGMIYRWTPNPGVRASRIAQARADLAYARAMRRHALGGVAYQVEEAYINAAEDDVVLRARASALAIARDRLDEATASHRSNQSDARDLSRASRDHVEQEIAHLRATGRALVSRSQLALSTGTLSTRE
jgi:outer membrane protein TolC